MTRKKLLLMFRFDIAAGRVFWKNPPWNHQGLIGKEAGCARPSSHNRKSYWVIKIDGVAYKRGHLLYFVNNGVWPKPTLDHKNGNSLDDARTNIRAATVVQNAQNHKTRRKKSNLPMGVRLTAAGRFQARIGFNKQQIHLGAYDSEIQAARVYQKNRMELFRDFA